MNSKPNQDHEALHDRAPALERENIQLRKDWAGLRIWMENEIEKLYADGLHIRADGP